MSPKEAKIVHAYRNVLAAPEAAARRFKIGAFVLVLFAIVGATVSGHMVAEKAQYNLGQILAIVSGLMIGVSFMLYLNAGQTAAFARFCQLKEEYREEPNKSPSQRGQPSVGDRSSRT